MAQIKFSHKYYKMPSAFEKSTLAHVSVTEEAEISDAFKEYDTCYPIEFTKEGHYPLPKGKLILLLLIANEGKGWLWCTMRRWAPAKEAYYRRMCGEVFDIVIEEATA